MPHLKPRTPEYRTWERLQAFPDLDDNWRNFATFKVDVGPRPSPAHQLRRQDKTKPHGPGNDLWIATVKPPKGTETATVKRLAKALNQTERTVWRKLAKGLSPAEIQQGQTRHQYVAATDESTRKRFDQKLAQMRADIQAAKDNLADLQDDYQKTLRQAQNAEVGDFSEPKPKPKPQTLPPTPNPAPPAPTTTPEPIKYTSFDLKLKEEKELARKKLMGADDPFKF